MEVFLRITLVFFTILAISSFVACVQKESSNSSVTENRVEFDTINWKAKHHLDGDTANPCCNITVEFIYPVAGSKAKIDLLQAFFIRNTFRMASDSLTPSKAVQTYVQNYVKNYIADAKTYRENTDENREISNLLISGMELMESDDYSDDYFYSYYENLTDSVVYNQRGILSFQVKQSNNKGGAASYDSYRNYVLNMQTGLQVTESDIFNAGYESALQQFIIASLLKQNDVKSVEELEDLGFFGVREIVPNSNFLLNNEGIIYTYNKGEYSAYQLDPPQVFISYQAIPSLLKENGIASKLADL